MTGVQTCALPIWQRGFLEAQPGIAVVGCRVRLFPAGATRGGMRRWAAWHNALLDHASMAREAFIDSPRPGSRFARRPCWYSAPNPRASAGVPRWSRVTSA